jgi:hypothetical protein
MTCAFVSCGKRSLPQMKYGCFLYSSIALQTLRYIYLSQPNIDEGGPVVSIKRFSLRPHRILRLNYVNDIQSVLFCKKQKMYT